MLRLHKFLAQAGLASRRHAEGLIKDGRVRVNGQLITELGAKIDPDQDEVSVDGRAVRAAEARTTVVLQKPVGVVTTIRRSRFAAKSSKSTSIAPRSTRGRGSLRRSPSAASARRCGPAATGCDRPCSASCRRISPASASSTLSW